MVEDSFAVELDNNKILHLGIQKANIKMVKDRNKFRLYTALQSLRNIGKQVMA